LLVTANVPERAPAAAGLKATLIEQVAPGFTVPQFELAIGNSDGLLLTMLCTVTGVPPVLLIVTVFAALVLPTAWLPKFAGAA
jgi:hypothetical protein